MQIDVMTEILENIAARAKRVSTRDSDVLNTEKEIQLVSLSSFWMDDQSISL